MVKRGKFKKTMGRKNRWVLNQKSCGKPPNHPILIGLSIIFTIHFGGFSPLFLETSMSKTQTDKNGGTEYWMINDLGGKKVIFEEGKTLDMYISDL